MCRTPDNQVQLLTQRSLIIIFWMHVLPKPCEFLEWFIFSGPNGSKEALTIGIGQLFPTDVVQMALVEISVTNNSLGNASPVSCIIFLMFLAEQPATSEL